MFEIMNLRDSIGQPLEQNGRCFTRERPQSERLARYPVTFGILIAQRVYLAGTTHLNPTVLYLSVDGEYGAQTEVKTPASAALSNVQE